MAYTLVKEFDRAYAWAGFSPKRSRTYGALESAFWMTFVEVPIDAFNPSQGFGVSDLIFDYAGVGLGILKTAHPGNWDLKASVKSNPFRSQSQLFAQTLQQFDNFVFWATYRPAPRWAERQPLSLGVGYGTHRAANGIDPVREIHLGIGTTIPDLVRAISPKAARYFDVLDFFYFNLNWRGTIK